jgi:hypothetical protein
MDIRIKGKLSGKRSVKISSDRFSSASSSQYRVTFSQFLNFVLLKFFAG